MSDSEGSVESFRGSEKSATQEEIAVPLPNRQNPSGDKLEEFEKLLQSMMASRSPSQEAEEPEENEIERKIGASFELNNRSPSKLSFYYSGINFFVNIRTANSLSPSICFYIFYLFVFIFFLQLLLVFSYSSYLLFFSLHLIEQLGSYHFSTVLIFFVNCIQVGM